MDKAEVKGGSNWFHDVECHFSPRWGLPYLDQYMLDTIKDTNRFELDLTILPDFMTIERLLFSAWIELSYNFKATEAVRLVRKAEEYLNNNFVKLGDGSLVGYGTIIYAFFVWIYHKSGSIKEFREAEEKLRELWNKNSSQSESKTLLPNFQVYVNVTHAWTLGRLGPEKRCKALRLLNKALEVNKCGHCFEQWLFSKALIQERAVRESICFDSFQITAHTYANLLKVLKNEKQTLQLVVTGRGKPRFDLAKAHLGKVMIVLDDITRKAKETAGSSKKKTDKKHGKRNSRTDKQVDVDRNAKQNTSDESVQTPLKYIKESLTDDRDGNLEVALILAKLNKVLDKTDMLQDILKYCESEIKIDGKNTPPDVYFQLGLLYYKQSKLTDDKSMMNKALRMVQKAVFRGKTHIEAHLVEAMILVNLHDQDPENSKKAKKIYSEILKERDSNTAAELHILRSVSSGSVRSIYEPLQYLQNVCEFLLLCVKRYVVKDYLGVFNFKSVVRKDANTRMDILQKEIESNSDDRKITYYAIQCLAEVNLHLERYREAEELLNFLKNLVFPTNKLETKLECDLAKCLYRLGKFQELRKLCEDGKAKTQSVKEIEVLVHLAEGKEKQHEMMVNCEGAIELGSLDGCLLMLTMHQHFQEKFFVLRERYAQRLAKIKLCIDRFQEESQQESDQGQKLSNKDKMREMVEEKMDVVLTYRRSRKVVYDSHESVYKKLNEIRRLLLDFECYLLLEKISCSTKEGFKECAERQCNHTTQRFSSGGTPTWSDNCRNAAEMVLTKSRFLLDEVMGCLQIAAIGKVHKHTVFPIIASWKKGYQDEKEAKKELQNRLSECRLCNGENDFYIPDSIFDSLLKIQPMFNEENQFLYFFAHIVNKIKHGGFELGPVCEHFNQNIRFQLCTSYVVRRSCEEVEKITLFLLNKCSEMM